MKTKLGLPLFLLTFFVVMACSLGAVSAANNIHDVKIDAVNTNIHHFDANIQDSNILNTAVNTNTAEIIEGDSGPDMSIIRSSISNIFSNSFNTGYYAGGTRTGGGLTDSEISNIVSASTNTEIGTGCTGGSVENSRASNIVSDSVETTIYMGIMGSQIVNSNISNIVDGSYDTAIQQGAGCRSDNNNLSNLVSESEHTIIRQGLITNSQISNTTISCENITINQVGYTLDQPQPIDNCNLSNLALFSKNTTITQSNLSGVNGCVLAIGCDEIDIPVVNLTDATFFVLAIGDSIFGFSW